MIEFRVRGRPVPQGSLRARTVRRRKLGQRTRFIVHDNDSALHVWRTTIAVAARVAGVRLGSSRLGTFRVRLSFYLPRVGRAPAPVHKHDLDKLIRSVLDALTGIAWHDDGQVTELRAVKRWAGDGQIGAWITIEEEPCS